MIASVINEIDIDPEPQTRLDLVVCDHCKKTFENQEELYEINCVKFNLHNLSFDLTTTEVCEPQRELLSVRRVIRFHKDCLCELAGSEWLI